MDNKTIRFIVSFTLNALIILAGIYLIFVMGNKAYSFGHNIFNEESVTSQADARQVEITLTGSEKSGGYEMKSIFSLLSFNTCISDSIPLLRIVSLLFTYSFNNPNH